jgi:hypothetical protein
VQGLRHGSSKVTLEVYAQAQVPAKRKVQHKVAEMVRLEALLEPLVMVT